MKNLMKINIVKLICTLVIISVLTKITSGLVLGIDFGSEHFKVVLVKPGGMDIALNEASGRKTATIVGFSGEERFIGDQASNLLAKTPLTVYNHLLSFLGRKINIDDPSFKQQMKFIPWLEKTTVDPETGTLLIKHDTNTTFLSEDAVAQILAYALQIGSSDVGHPVKDAVITVPSYWTHSQRQALLDAAKLAGLNVLSLINQNAAIALNFGIERVFSNPQHVMFFDMGASDLQVSLYRFTSTEDKKKKSIGNAQLVAQAWDVNLGGKAFDDRIVQHFLKQIESKGVKLDARGMIKLQKNVKKAKEILSANKETFISIEGLAPDFDFKARLTREELEEMLSDMFLRAIDVVKKVLTSADMDTTKVDMVELFGGGCRVPKLQEELLKFFGRETLDKHLNTDEAAVFGAALHAASVSAQHRIREFKMKDSMLAHYPVLVSKTSEDPADANASTAEDVPVEGEDSDESGGLQSGDIKELVLFKSHSRYNSRRTLKFFSQNNFSIQLKYGDSKDFPPGTFTDLGLYEVSGIPTTEQYNMTGKPWINVKFLLSPSGTVVLSKATANITTVSLKEVKVPKTKPGDEKPTEETTTETTTNQSEEDDVNNESTETPKEEQQDNQEEKSENTEKKNEDEVKEDKKSEEEQKPVEEKPVEEDVETVIKEVRKNQVINLKVKPIYQHGLNSEQLDKSKKKLKELDEKEKARRETLKAKNNLESYIYETKDKLYSDEFTLFSTEEEREKLTNVLTHAAEWLDDEGIDTTRKAYVDKQKEVSDVADKVLFRIKEDKARPQAIEQCNTTLNFTRFVCENITNRLEVSEEEKNNLLAKSDEIEEWLEEQIEVQEKVPKHEDPKLTSAEITRKCSELQYKLKSFMKRPVKRPPKPPKKKDAAEGSDDTKTSTDDTKSDDNTNTKTDDNTNTQSNDDNTNTKTDDTNKDEL